MTWQTALLFSRQNFPAKFFIPGTIFYSWNIFLFLEQFFIILTIGLLGKTLGP
jgi:hypothetical protein